MKKKSCLPFRLTLGRSVVQFDCVVDDVVSSICGVLILLKVSFSLCIFSLFTYNINAAILNIYMYYYTAYSNTYNTNYVCMSDIILTSFLQCNYPIELLFHTYFFTSLYYTILFYFFFIYK